MRRILVVDDDADQRLTLQTLFESQGYHVSMACDGSAGLVRAERDAPDLVILDVMMPKRSGFVVLERIHAWPEGRPQVIMVSAHDEQRFRSFAEAYGATAFLTKPYNLEVLLAEVDRILKPLVAASPVVAAELRPDAELRLDVGNTADSPVPTAPISFESRFAAPEPTPAPTLGETVRDSQNSAAT